MRLSGWNLPINRISASSLATAIICPEQYRRKYVLKHKEKMWGDRFIGIADHETWEEYFQVAMLPTEEARPLFDLETSFRNRWQQLLEKEGEVQWGKDEPETVYKRSLAMLRAYLPYAERIDPVGVEEWFEVAIPDVPVPLVGKIDLRETHRIIDRKTNGNRLSKPKSRWRLQARLYQLACPLPFDWHVVTKQVTPQVVTPAEAPDLHYPLANPDVTVRMIQHTVARISDCYARYGADTPWPTEGTMGDWACDYCGYGPKGDRSCFAWQT